MKKPHLLTAGAAALTLAFGGTATADRDANASDTAMFQVTVTNLTLAQPLSPVLLATHDTSASVFTPGQPASPELARLAEDGDNSQLLLLLDGAPGVQDTASGLAPIGPSGSETIMIEASRQARYLSLASMLVNTNDAFVGLDTIELSPRGTTTLYGVAFDAGSEANSEDCAYIPGPACGSAFSHDPAPAEGFIFVSNGIHGIGSLPSDRYDWRNPVAKIEITRMP